MASLKVFKKRLVVTMIFVLLMHGIKFVKSQSGGVMGGDSFSSSDDDFSSSFDTYDNKNPCEGHRGSTTNSSTDQDCNKDQTMSNFVVPFVFFLLLACFLLIWDCVTSDNMKRKTVLMLQIGLLDEGRYAQRDLNRIAKTTRTDTMKGLTKILQETTKSLLQHPNSWLYGFSSVDEVKSTEQMRQRFNKLSKAERAKLDVESLVNVNDVICKHHVTPKLENNAESYMVVTILLATQRSHNLKAAKNSKSIKEALEFLGSVRIEQNEAVLVIWSPQDENESMSEKQMKEKYPLLRPIEDVLNGHRNPSHVIKIN